MLTATIVNLGVINGSTGGSQAIAGNDQGLIVGGSGFGTSTQHAILYKSGAKIDLGVLDRIIYNNQPSYGYDINNTGQVVGYSQILIADNPNFPDEPTAYNHAFLITPIDTNGDGQPDTWNRDLDGDGTNDLMTDLGTFPVPVGFHGESLAWGINDQGQVVGDSSVAVSGPRNPDSPDESNIVLSKHAFLKNVGGGLINLGTLGGNFSSAHAINNKGQAVGWSSTNPDEGFYFLDYGGAHFEQHTQHEHAFLYQGGGMTDLGTLGGDTSEAHAINDAGQVVGSSKTADGLVHAFRITPIDTNGDGQPDVWNRDLNGDGKNDLMTDLGALNGGFSYAYGINQRGDVVGTTQTSSGSFPFLYQNGVEISLQDQLPADSGWVLKSAFDITATGTIIGYGRINGSNRAFTLTVSQPPVSDVALSSLAWNTTQGGVNFTYAVSGAALTQATSVALYWSANATFEPSSDTRIAGSVTTTGTAVNTYGPINISAATLGTPPVGTKYLLAVADPDDQIAETNETNNVRSLLLPDLTPTSLIWNGASGVNIQYAVRDAALPVATTVSLYWATDTTLASRFPTPISTSATQQAVGAYGPITVGAASLANPPLGAKYLLAVTDVDGKVAESDETNNIQALRLPDIALTSLTRDASGNANILYSINDAALPVASTISLYWATDTTLASRLPTPISTSTTQQAVGSYGPITVDAVMLSEPPVGARYLLAVADVGNTVIESDETNNIQAVRLPDIALTSLTRDADGNAKIQYAITDAALPVATTVSLYWATDTTFASRLPTPISTFATAQAVGSYGPITVAAASLATPPQGARYLLAVADPSNTVVESDETNNIKALTLTDLSLVEFFWNRDRDNTPENAGHRGVDFTYRVTGTGLPANVTIAFYWADENRNPIGTAGAGSTSVVQPLSTLQINTSPGLHNRSTDGFEMTNDPVRWGKAPVGAKYVLAMLDPGNHVTESNKSNNILTLELATPSQILKDSVVPVPSGVDISATFSPGQGLYPISEAEVVLGVDHFNWIQKITHVPGSWDTRTVIDADPTQSAIVATPAGLRYLLFNSDGTPALNPDGSQVVGTTPINSYHVDTPFLDKIVHPFGPTGSQKYTRAFLFANGQVGVLANLSDDGPRPATTPDGYYYYFNESIPAPLNDIDYYTDLGALTFVDSPHAPIVTVVIGPDIIQQFVPFIQGRAGEYLGFETRLVGIAYNQLDTNQSTYTDYMGQGYQTAFTWKSNAINETSGGVFGILQLDGPAKAGLGRLVSGGVFDVTRIDTATAEPVLTLDPIADQQVNQGAPVKVQAVGHGAVEGEPLVFSLDPGAPAGSTIDPATGQFTWNPTTPGTFPVTVRAVGGVSSTSRMTSFTISVANVNVPPTVVFNVLSQGNVVAGDVFQVTGKLNNLSNLDLSSATVSYNDGLGEYPLAVASDGTFTVSHVYPSPGLFAFIVGVRDKSGILSSSSLPIVVAVATVVTPPPVLNSGFGAGRDAFVTELYRNHLGRLPEPLGLRYWSGKLAAHTPPRKVALTIWQSPEHRQLVKQHLAPKITFQRAFANALKAGQRAARLHASHPTGPMTLSRSRVNHASSSQTHHR